MRRRLPGEPRTPPGTGTKQVSAALPAVLRTALAVPTGRRLLTGGWRIRMSSGERLRCRRPAPKGRAHRFPAPRGPLGGSGDVLVNVGPARFLEKGVRARQGWEVPHGGYTPQPCRPWMTLSRTPLKRDLPKEFFLSCRCFWASCCPSSANPHPHPHLRGCSEGLAHCGDRLGHSKTKGPGVSTLLSQRLTISISGSSVQSPSPGPYPAQ